jgi:signal transduction histidine kinase
LAIQTVTASELETIRQAQPIADDSNNHSGLSILRLLTTSDRAQVAKMIYEQKYFPGDVIFKEGDMGHTMAIVRSGRAAVIKGSFNTPTVLGFRGAGEVIGEMALLEDRPRSASIVAVEKVSLLEISRDNFEIFLSNNTDLGLNILGTLSARLRAADEARRTGMQAKQELTQQIINLTSEKEHLLEQNRLRQDTSDLIIHDLRNPLGLVSGGINLLELTLPVDLVQLNSELLYIINANLDRMRRLVDSLLDVAQMDTGNILLSLAEVSPAALVNKTISQMKPMLTNYEITVDVDVPAELPTIKVDEEKMNRVLSNLLDNAFKYTRSGGKVFISVQKNDQHVLISVTNTGPTIPPEDRQRVFERFTRVSGGKPDTSGFGLGLAFCRMAIEAHNGKIWVEPLEAGPGNRFVFTLPLL